MVISGHTYQGPERTTEQGLWLFGHSTQHINVQLLKNKRVGTSKNIWQPFMLFHVLWVHHQTPCPPCFFPFLILFFLLFCPVSGVPSFFYIPCMSFFAFILRLLLPPFYAFLYMSLFAFVPSCICYFCSLSLTLPLWHPLIVYIRGCHPPHCSLIKTVTRQSKRLCFKKKARK